MKFRGKIVLLSTIIFSVENLQSFVGILSEICNVCRNLQLSLSPISLTHNAADWHCRI